MSARVLQCHYCGQSTPINVTCCDDDAADKRSAIGFGLSLVRAEARLDRELDLMCKELIGYFRLFHSKGIEVDPEVWARVIAQQVELVEKACC